VLTHERQVVDELGPPFVSTLARPKDRRRVQGDHDRHLDLRDLEHGASEARDPGASPEDRLGGSPPEKDEEVGLDGRELDTKPQVTGPDLGPARRVVDAACAFRAPLEVLDGVREIELALPQPDLLEDGP
jgi:hypothetical protein